MRTFISKVVNFRKKIRRKKNACFEATPEVSVCVCTTYNLITFAYIKQIAKRFTLFLFMHQNEMCVISNIELKSNNVNNKFGAASKQRSFVEKYLSTKL